MPAIFKKLANGINLFTVPLKSTKAITVLALFPVGSRYEHQKISGASHFVEHLMFKGTHKRPSYLQISLELDAAGAEYNAFTSKDHTGYYIRIDSSRRLLIYCPTCCLIRSWTQRKLKKKKV